MELDINRFYSLAVLTSECARYGVALSHVETFENGFQVMFAGCPNCDAILHDYSYGNNKLLWESMGFPWDGNDVSTHTATELAALIGEYVKAR